MDATGTSARRRCGRGPVPYELEQCARRRIRKGRALQDLAQTRPHSTPPSGRGAAAPRYSSPVSFMSRTLTSGPSIARTTSARVISVQPCEGAARRRAPLDLILVDPAPEAGWATVYATEVPEYRLDVPVGGMSCCPDDPGHFRRRLCRHGESTVTAADFASRYRYGSYPADTLGTAVPAVAFSGVADLDGTPALGLVERTASACEGHWFPTSLLSFVRQEQGRTGCGASTCPRRAGCGGPASGPRRFLRPVLPQPGNPGSIRPVLTRRRPTVPRRAPTAVAPAGPS